MSRRCYVKELFEFFWRAYGPPTEDVAKKTILFLSVMQIHFCYTEYDNHGYFENKQNSELKGL